MKKTFIIEYKILDKNNLILKEGKIKVKNKINRFEAQCGLEEFLKKKYLNFNQLIIKDCKEENPFNSIFGDIFGKNNPFSQS
jgi:hypothetical protein